MMMVGRARERRNIVYRKLNHGSNRNLGMSLRQPRVLSAAEWACLPFASIGALIAYCVGVVVLHVLWVGLRCFG